MLALNELEPITEAPPAPGPQRSSAPAPKYNSTSSIYIDSTITRPCIDEIIFCVSIVIHDRIEEGALHAAPARGATADRECALRVCLSRVCVRVLATACAQASESCRPTPR